MTRVLAAVLALAVVAVPPAAFAGHSGFSGHPHNFSGYGHNFRSLFPQSYDGTAPAEAYPNCLPWSPRLRTWVWVCGAPYPPHYPRIG